MAVTVVSSPSSTCRGATAEGRRVRRSEPWRLRLSYRTCRTARVSSTACEPTATMARRRVNALPSPASSVLLSVLLLSGVQLPGPLPFVSTFDGAATGRAGGDGFRLGALHVAAQPPEGYTALGGKLCTVPPEGNVSGTSL